MIPREKIAITVDSTLLAEIERLRSKSRDSPLSTVVEHAAEQSEAPATAQDALAANPGDALTTSGWGSTKRESAAH